MEKQQAILEKELVEVREEKSFIHSQWVSKIKVWML